MVHTSLPSEFRIQVSQSPSSDTPSMADSLIDEDDEEDTCESSDPLNHENDYGDVQSWTAIVHHSKIREGTESSSYQPKETQTKTVVTPQKLDGSFLSGSCLGTCLFGDAISDMTNMIQTAVISEIESAQETFINLHSTLPQNVSSADDVKNNYSNEKENKDVNALQKCQNQYYYDWAVLCGGEEVGNQTVPSPQKCQRVPCNRAGNRRSREIRLQNLQKNLSPFELHGPIQLDAKAISFKMDTSSSFVRARTQSSSLIASMTNNAIGSVQLCGQPLPNATSDPVDELPSKDLCYDSDPGDIEKNQNRRIRTFVGKPSLKKGARLNSANTNYGSCRDLFEPDVSYIKEVMNTTMTLIWHRPQSGLNEESSPIAVHAWVEYGMRLRTALIHPKFMWKPIYDPKNKQKEQYDIGQENVQSIDLLDMTKIIGVRRVDRNLYPLANHSRSFVLEAYGKEFLFETKCPQTKARFVRGLKFTVARLGSKIIVGDQGVFDEFFDVSENESYDATVPGEAPNLNFSDISGISN